MKISECMSTELRVITPDETIQDAARAMAEQDVGILPVTIDQQLVGIVTDRDIAIRGIGKGCGPDTVIEDVMSREVTCCFAGQDSADVLEAMSTIQVRRLPVVNDNRNLIGIVSITDLAAAEAPRTGQALGEIGRPSAQHSQSL
ncbi:MAG: CBS domain-containing protein [Sphingomonadaceae bacterium]|nr:CBS domain-containing protein [Sphingomonadaceae bacterium]